MKKLLPLILVAAVAMLAYTSCKKQDSDKKEDEVFYAISLNITSSGDASLPDAIKKIFDDYTKDVTSIVSSANDELRNISKEDAANSKFYDTNQLVKASRDNYQNELAKYSDKAKRTVTPALSLRCSSDPSKDLSYAEIPLIYDNKTLL